MFIRSLLQFRHLESADVTGARIFGKQPPRSNGSALPSGYKPLRKARAGLTIANYYTPVLTEFTPAWSWKYDKQGEIRSRTPRILKTDMWGLKKMTSDKQLYQDEKTEWYKVNKNKFPTKKFAGARQKKKKK